MSTEHWILALKSIKKKLLKKLKKLLTKKRKCAKINFADDKEAKQSTLKSKQ